MKNKKPDYVCVHDMESLCLNVCSYHWVHKSEKDPVEFVKNLNPDEVLF